MGKKYKKPPEKFCPWIVAITDRILEKGLSAPCSCVMQLKKFICTHPDLFLENITLKQF